MSLLSKGSWLIKSPSLCSLSPSSKPLQFDLNDYQSYCFCSPFSDHLYFQQCLVSTLFPCCARMPFLASPPNEKLFVTQSPAQFLSPFRSHLILLWADTVFLMFIAIGLCWKEGRTANCCIS